MMKAFLSKLAINTLWTDLLFGVLSILAAFLLVALLMLMVGFNPLEAYRALLHGSLGSLNGLGETFTKATPLLLIALGISIAFRGGVWNIGAEGQLLLGAIGASIVGLHFPALPPFLHLGLMLAAGICAGALWGAIPGYLRGKWGANEIVITIMLNYLAIQLLSYLVSGPMRDTTRFVPVPRTALFSPSAFLPRLIPRTRLHAGLLIALLALVIVWVLMKRTALGYEIRTVGSNPTAAAYGGINTVLISTIAMALSGGLAGIAGMSEVAGIHHQLLEGISPGYGYLAIAVALFGGLRPSGILFSSVFFGALLVGADSMQRAVGVPVATVYLLQGLVLIFVLGRRLLHFGRLVRVDGAEREHG